MNISLTQILRQSVQRRGQAPVIHCAERSTSQAQLLDRVQRLAAALRAHGVRAGDRVGLLGLNSDRYVEAMMAVWWAGAVLNPVNTRWSAEEIAFSLDDCETGLLLVGQAFEGLLPVLRERSQHLRQVVLMDAPAFAPNSMEAWIAGHAPVADAGRAGDDIAGIFYTGGTTGRPKGVMLSHAALVTNAWISLAELHIAEQDVLLMTAPLFHLAGLSFLLRAMIRSCEMVFIPGFTPEGVFEAVQRHRVTGLFVVPVMLQMLADHHGAAEHDLSGVQLIAYGGSGIAEAVLDRAFKVFPSASFVQGYGMTELAAGVSYLPAHCHTVQGRQGRLLQSAGRALPGIDLRIVDPQGVPVPAGVTGELLVRSPSVMSGYWNRPEETREVLRNGWMHTGDAAWMNAQGFVFIVDRLKDMVVTGGENVYCAEVENVIASHPAVAAVAVIGIPSLQWGEVVHAIVVLKPGANLILEELQSHCRSRIAGYKCPKSLALAPALPMSGAGKVLKYQLRKPYWQGHARQVG